MIKINPFVKIITSNGIIIHDRISQFSYKYSEEEDDLALITITSGDRYLADRPEYQEGVSLVITWGYLDSPNIQTRKVYIFDTEVDYSEEGITLKLTCHEKFALSKMDTASPKNKTTIKDSTTLVLSSETLKQFYLDVESGNSELAKVLSSSGIALEPFNPRTAPYIDQGFINPQINQNKNPLPNRTFSIYKPLQLAKGTRIVGSTRTENGLEFTYANGNAATFRALRAYLDKTPGGPYVIDSRDDKVTIKARNFSQNPLRKYEYGGEDGELISFTPETKNRSKAKSSSSITTAYWDSDKKEAKVSTVTKKTNGSKTTLAEGSVEKLLQKGLEKITMMDKVPNKKEPSGELYKLTGKPANVPPVSGPNSNEDLAVRNADGTYSNPTSPNQKGVSGDIIYRGEDYGLTTKGPGRVIAIDNTAVYKPPYIRKIPVVPGTMNKYIYTGNNETQSKAFADNKRKQEELDNNPATAKMVGEALITSGILLTITGVAKRHQGNYYVSECEHSIEEGSGYLTSITKMVRQGINIDKTQVKSKTPQSTQASVDYQRATGLDTSNYYSSTNSINLKVGPIEARPYNDKTPNGSLNIKKAGSPT